MTHKAFALMAGLALAGSIGTANADDPSSRAAPPAALGSADVAEYHLLSTEDMVNTTGSDASATIFVLSSATGNLITQSQSQTQTYALSQSGPLGSVNLAFGYGFTVSAGFSINRPTYP